jgi:hypothetical protein
MNAVAALDVTLTDDEVSVAAMTPRRDVAPAWKDVRRGRTQRD